MKPFNLSNLENEPAEIREAVAFYAAHTVLPISFTREERERHYSVLEQAGYIEKVGVPYGGEERILPLSRMQAQA
jgi:hypothetical protein